MLRLAPDLPEPLVRLTPVLQGGLHEPGQALDGRAPRRGSAQAGYVPQQRDFDRDLPIRGRDLVQVGVYGHRRGLPFARPRQLDAVMAAVGAQDYADAPIGLLSGGQQQRIAQALAGRPRLLLCDEPLLSLDPACQQSVTALLAAYRREHGTIVVIVTDEIPRRPGSSTASCTSPVAVGRPAPLTR